MICENCGKEHDGSLRSGRFCSIRCARSFASKLNRSEKNKKISLALLERRRLGKTKTDFTPRYCKDCNSPIGFRNKTGYCVDCYRKFHVKHSPDSIEKQRQKMKGRKRWHIYGNMMSFPERYFKKILTDNRIKFEQEVFIKNENTKHGYFLDFKIGNIDLEIDGKQHKFPDRAKRDEVRDDFLRSKGYFVYRIRWTEIKSQEGREIMKEKIDSLLEFLDKFS